MSTKTDRRSKSNVALERQGVSASAGTPSFMGPDPCSNLHNDVRSITRLPLRIWLSTTMQDVPEQVIESWYTNNRINLMLIDHISDEGLSCTLSRRGGRNVIRQFGHLHNNRVWGMQRRARHLSEALHVFETHDEPDRPVLRDHLEQSADVLADYFRLVVAGDNRVRCFKKGPIAYLCYLVAHESHHRGNILLTLKQSGHPVDKDVRYAIWDWDRR